jgi:hypothetical protein
MPNRFLALSKSIFTPNDYRTQWLNDNQTQNIMFHHYMRSLSGHLFHKCIKKTEIVNTHTTRRDISVY